MFIPISFSFVISFLLTFWLQKPNNPLKLMDSPGERSLHHQPTPRGGGFAVLGGLLGGVLLFAIFGGEVRGLSFLFLGTVLIVIVSLIDDFKGLSPFLRISVHFGAAGLFLVGFGPLKSLEIPILGLFQLGVGAWIFTLFFIVWVTNLYNFMDGMDGFAGGMSIIGFSFFAVLGWVGNHTPFLVLSLIVVASHSGFLLWNFPPARIFMGDLGAATTGFLVAVFSVWGVKDGLFPLWAPSLVFSVFICDASFTLLLRLLHKKPVWKAHRTHCYQKLVLSGWSHRKTVLFSYLMMLASGGSALFLVYKNQPDLSGWGMVIWTVSYLLLFVTIQYKNRA